MSRKGHNAIPGHQGFQRVAGSPPDCELAACATVDDGSFDAMRDAMLDRRTLGGFRREESAVLFDALVRNHEGDNLASALVYEGFASERVAARFVNELVPAATADSSDSDTAEHGDGITCIGCGGAPTARTIDGYPVCDDCRPDDDEDMADDDTW